MTTPILELAAQAFAEATATPPLLYQLGVEGARATFDSNRARTLSSMDETWTQDVYWDVYGTPGVA